MASLPLSSSACLRLFSVLVLVSLQFLAVRSQQYHFCSNDRGNYTVNSTFATNLNSLVSSLSSLQRNPDGFYNVSVGETTNMVNSVSLCRGEVAPVDCLACVSAAGEEITRRCPNQKEAIIWYDSCMVRYTNRTILNVMEMRPAFYMANGNNFTGDLEGIEMALRGLLEGLRDRAGEGGVRKKFAADRFNAPSLPTLYGMVQCSPDLSEQDCSSCLTRSFGDIPACCDRRIGCRLHTPTCFFRYETYRFYDATAAEETVPPPPPPPPANETSTDGEGKKNGYGEKVVIFVFVPVAIIAALLITSFIVFLTPRKKNPTTRKHETSEVTEEIISADSLLFDFRTIREATDNFSPEKKLGQGGFGTVYKGMLRDGQEIAVKRLSRDTGQGETEFKNEVLLVAKLQHRNLVRLLGFSTKGNERLLVYEFVKNASLDNFLFDAVKKRYLDWGKRYEIIGGIARGLLYLHEDSRLRIIHRDLKASNVLLDEEMNAKIADFGVARLFDIDQTTQRFTSKIVGTLGYMPPEYAMHGQFSFKTDVYSFGVLVLEIVSGKRNNWSRDGEDAEDLVSLAWRNWREGTLLNLIDPSLRYGSRNEMLRCISIGLLCVQEKVANRPSMALVVMMLSSHSLALPVPTPPAFSMRHVSRFDLPSSDNLNSRATDSRER
ncbi:PREDICTED: cysteine-rich receptor-like protein kinase 26 [Tarenaya hassleriana]|uniref:cysteine-rich receptor-like protein kinase 26 n=1 Tax=Tarenaya hassleriana TaxID=28532 RepID=UPI00053C575E|nr:PREDICTED: cysteine-rich receptor-like protein kinase 26 [Tarenaya hassleriana]